MNGNSSKSAFRRVVPALATAWRFGAILASVCATLLMSRSAEVPKPGADSNDPLIQAILDAPTPEARAELLPKGNEEARALAKRLHSLLEKQRSRRLSDAALELAMRLGETNLLAESWYWRAKVFAARSDLDEAAAAFQRSARLAAQIRDADRESAARMDLARIHLKNGELAAASQEYERALALVRSIQPASRKTRYREASLLLNLGEVCRQRRQFDKAREHLEASRSVSAEMGNAFGVTEADSNLAAVAIDTHHLDEAELLLLRTLPVYRASNDLAGVGMTLANLASVYEDRNQPDLALKTYFQALEVQREPRAKDEQGEAKTLNSIGGALLRLGQPGEAIPWLEQSLAIATNAGFRRLQAMVKHNLGEAKRKAGDLDAALCDLLDSLTLELAMANSTGAAHTRGARAAILFHVGRFEEAAEEFRGLAREFSQLGRKGGEARSLQNLAGVLTALCEVSPHDEQAGRWSEALGAFDKALALHRDLKDAQSECLALNNLGFAQALSGREDAARSFESARSLAREKHFPTEEARACIGLGHIALQRTNHDAAIRHFTNALTLSQFASSSELALDIHVGLGRAWMVENKFDRALTEFDAAMSIVEAGRARVRSPMTRSGLFSQRTRPYFDRATCLLKQSRTFEAWQTVERAKSRTLLDLWSGVPGLFERATSAGERQRLAALESHVTTLQLQEQTNSGLRNDERFQAAIQQARLEAESFWQGILAKHPDLALRLGDCEVPDRARLSALFSHRSMVFLEYVVEKESTLLFALAPPGAQAQPAQLIAHHVPVTRARLTSLVRNFRERLAQRGFEPARDSDADRELRELQRLLIEPAREFLAGTELVAIVPDGVLWELPFAALRAADGKLLIEDHPLFYVQSVSALLAAERLATQRRTTAPTQVADILVVADPELSGTGPNPSTALGNFAGIPGTRLQANALKSQFGQRVRVLLGREASEENLRVNLPQSRILHVSTHGHFDASPLHCGVWLTRTPGYDGLWTAREILSSDLPLDLAVLPACETGRGRAFAGEGMMGLGWALSAAGCRTSILTQWAVADESTAKLMVAFYRRLIKHPPGKSPPISIPQALRDTQLELLHSKEHKHPFHWAPFIVLGNPFLDERH